MMPLSQVSPRLNLLVPGFGFIHSGWVSCGSTYTFCIQPLLTDHSKVAFVRVLVTKGDQDVCLIFPYIHNPTPTIIAKMMSPIIMGASSFIKKTTIAIITIKAIIPTIIVPIVPHPK
jgi:hypothetical protein